MVGRGTSSYEDWKASAPNTGPPAVDLNMDKLFCCPQLSGGNFSYTRLPHVSRGVFAAGPIQGTYALAAEQADAIFDHLKALALAQARLYGGAPSAVAFAPPPPGWGRSAVRAASAPRANSTPAEPVVIPGNLGIVVRQMSQCALFLIYISSCFGI